MWTLVAICIDRYQAIIKPLARKQSKKTARLVILGIWVAGGLTALPMGAAHTFQQVLDLENGGLKPFCSVRWSSIEDDSTVEEDSGYHLLVIFQVYFVTLLLLEYLAPLSSCISKSDSFGLCNPPLNELQQARRTRNSRLNFSCILEFVMDP